MDAIFRSIKMEMYIACPQFWAEVSDWLQWITLFCQSKNTGNISMPVRGCIYIYIYIYIYIMQKQQNSTYLPVSGQSSLPVLVDWSTVFHSQSTNLGMQWNLLQGSSLLQTCFIQQVEDISKKQINKTREHLKQNPWLWWGAPVKDFVSNVPLFCLFVF